MADIESLLATLQPLLNNNPQLRDALKAHKPLCAHVMDSPELFNDFMRLTVTGAPSEKLLECLSEWVDHSFHGAIELHGQHQAEHLRQRLLVGWLALARFYAASAALIAHATIVATQGRPGNG